MKQIKTIKELRKSIDRGNYDYVIRLNGGFLSRKTICTDDWDEKFEITNEIDGTEQILSATEIFDENLTNIGLAMKRGSFFAL